MSIKLSNYASAAQETIEKEQEKNNLKLLFVAIDGKKDDFLLAPALLQTYALQDTAIQEQFEFDIYYQTRIIIEEHKSVCRSISDMVIKNKPDVVAFPCYVWNYSAVVEISSSIKHHLPQTIIVWGGPEIQLDDIKENKFAKSPADYLVYGEGEVPFTLLLRHLLGREELNSLPRVAYRSNAKNVWELNDINDPNIIDLATAPSAYLSGGVSDSILKNHNITAIVETQRGCNFKCAYCLYHKNFTHIRYRPVSAV
ncbi:MAG: B12-binding domain-containing radical SAM protein, partial [Anaerovoracaceae bacterium]